MPDAARVPIRYPEQNNYLMAVSMTSFFMIIGGAQLKTICQVLTDFIQDLIIAI